jgi:L-fuconolactonase
VTVLDAHVHLWDLAARPQAWTAQFPFLQRSFLLPELEKVLDDHGTDAAVVVQAGDTTGETLDLLALASTTPRLAGVVGWVDLDGPDVAGAAAALRRAPGGGKLVSVRHQLQVEPDPRYLARPGVRNGLAAVAEAGLAYDIVVSPWQLPLVTETAAALPGVRFVLDHAGKPPVASGDLRAWQADLARLAELPNVAVKLSGLVTETDWATWTQTDLAPVIDHVLACFGAGRAMAGSDWPVCLLVAGYGAVQATLDPPLGRLDAAGRAAVLGGSAARWYRVGAR